MNSEGGRSVSSNGCVGLVEVASFAAFWSDDGLSERSSRVGSGDVDCCIPRDMADLLAPLSLLRSLFGERLCEPLDVLEVLEVLEWIDPGDMVSIEELIRRCLAPDRTSVLRFLVAVVATESEELTSKRS